MKNMISAICALVFSLANSALLTEEEKLVSEESVVFEKNVYSNPKKNVEIFKEAYADGSCAFMVQPENFNWFAEPSFFKFKQFMSVVNIDIEKGERYTTAACIEYYLPRFWNNKRVTDCNNSVACPCEDYRAVLNKYLVLDKDNK